jgi:hypothetical protein
MIFRSATNHLSLDASKVVLGVWLREKYFGIERGGLGKVGLLMSSCILYK